MPPTIIHKAIRFTLTGDKVTPDKVIEHRPIQIFFTLTNILAGVVSGVVSCPFGGKRLIRNLAPGASFSSVLVSSAPSAGAAVEIPLDFYEDPPPRGVEFPGPSVTGGTDPIAIGATYQFSIGQFKILKTRAVHNDTDFVGLQVGIDGNQSPMHWKDMGDVNDGVHGVEGLFQGPFEIMPTTTVGMAYTIQNYGYNLGGLKAFFDLVSGSAADVLSAVFQGSDWTQVDSLTKLINNKQFANCDGVTVIDAHSFTGQKLNDMTAGNGFFNEERSYPPDNLSPEQSDLYKSADGCGASSRYTVTYSIERTSFQK
jgi:hypothetical protein